LGQFPLQDDKNTYRLLDTLAATDAAHEPLYFYLLTKALSQADGAIAQQANTRAYDYVRLHAPTFFAYLSDSQQAGRKPTAALFAQAIATVLKAQQSTVADFEQQLTANCATCTEAQKEMIKAFCSSISPL
jgi:hypothetical protein